MNFKISIFGINDEEINQKSMILTSDEIISVKYKTRTTEDRNFANTNSEVSVRLKGKIFSGLEEKSNGQSAFSGINSVLEEYKSNILKNNSGEIKNQYTGILKKLDDKVFQGIDKFDFNNFYEHNKKNIMELTNWALDYKSKGEYRNILIEINTGNEKSMNLLFENMYVENFEQEFDIEAGNGEFLLELKQKFYNGNKIKME